MHVGDLLRSKGATVVSVEPEARVSTALRLLMEHRIGALPVLEHGRLAGLVGERDIIRALDQRHDDIRGLPVSGVMQRAVTCRIDDDLRDVMGRMTRERLRHLVVLQGGAVAGMISVGDIVKHRLEELELEAGVLRDYVAAQRALT